MRRLLTIGWCFVLVFAIVHFATLNGSAQAEKKTGNLILRGDLAIFIAPGKPNDCTLRNVYHRGESVGFRIEAVDPETGEHVEPEAKLVVHLNYRGKIRDISMRWHGTAATPERKFWVARWIVPDATTGIVRFTVTAIDKYGRTGEYKPFDVDSSQLTIVE